MFSKKLIFTVLAVLIAVTCTIGTVAADDDNNIITTTTTDPTATHSIYYQIDNIIYEVKDIAVGELISIEEYKPDDDTTYRWTSDDVQIVNNSFVMPDKNVNLIAVKVVPYSYTISYYLNGGEINGDYQNTYSYGETYQLPTDVTKYNDTFVGWYSDPRYIGGKVTEITPADTGDKRFYAKYLSDEKYAPSEKYDKITTDPIDPKQAISESTGIPIEELTNSTTTTTTATTSPLPVIIVLAGLTIAGLLTTKKH